MLDTYKYRVDFAKAESYMDIHEILKRDLDFPDYYGGNLDALWDCLTDMLCYVSYIEICNYEKIAKKHADVWKELLETFRETKHAFGNKYSDRFFVTLIRADGKREEIE